MRFNEENKSEALVERLDVRFDLLSLQKEVDALLKSYNFLSARTVKQIMLTCRESDRDPDFDGVGKQDPSLSNEEYQRQFNKLNPTFSGTYLEEILRSFPYEFGRVRLMILDENRCYSIHTDRQPRYHMAIWTDPGCYILYKGHPKWFHIPNDGHVYVVHTHMPHTAVNYSPSIRVHLVFDSVAGY